jgi:hypothetical protein
MPSSRKKTNRKLPYPPQYCVLKRFFPPENIKQSFNETRRNLILYMGLLEAYRIISETFSVPLYKDHLFSLFEDVEEQIQNFNHTLLTTLFVASAKQSYYAELELHKNLSLLPQRGSLYTYKVDCVKNILRLRQNIQHKADLSAFQAILMELPVFCLKDYEKSPAILKFIAPLQNRSFLELIQMDITPSPQLNQLVKDANG